MIEIVFKQIFYGVMLQIARKLALLCLSSDAGNLVRMFESTACVQSQAWDLGSYVNFNVNRG